MAKVIGCAGADHKAVHPIGLVKGHDGVLALALTQRHELAYLGGCSFGDAKANVGTIQYKAEGTIVCALGLCERRRAG